MKFQIAVEKEAAASKMPPRTQNSGVEEKTKSCLVCLRWWEEGLISGPLKNSASTAPIIDTMIPINWTCVVELLKFNFVFLEKSISIKLSINNLHVKCGQKIFYESFQEPENDREQEIECWDQVAHGTYKYWRTVA